jgi:hypothetical protein
MDGEHPDQGGSSDNRGDSDTHVSNANPPDPVIYPIKARFVISEYETAWGEVSEVALQSVQTAEGLFALVRPEQTRHAGPMRNVRAPEPLDQPMKQFSVPMIANKDVFINGEVDEHTQMLYDFAKAHLDVVAPAAFESMRQVAEAAGMIEAQIEGKTALDVMRANLQKMDMEFDDDGKLKNLSILTHPDNLENMKKVMAEAEQDPECQRIMVAKREEYFATKRYRRLS